MFRIILRIMWKVLATSLFILAAGAARAQPSPLGYWQTQDGGGVIDVTRCGADLCAHIAGVVLDHPTDATPTDYQGVSQCDLPLITDAKPDGPNLWRGHITDPRNGRVYGVELHVDEAGRLGVRGFLAVPLLGRTDYWTRFAAVPPADCRMVRPDSMDATAGKAGSSG